MSTLDLILYNGIIRTMESETAVAEAVGIRYGKICFVGTNAQAGQLQAKQRIDLKGRLVLPGFEDSHLHMLNYAFVENAVKVFDCASAEEIPARISKADRSMGWVYARGWNEKNFAEKRYPARQELDAACPDVPAAAVRVCGHVGVLNSCALKKISELDGFQDVAQDVDLESGLTKETALGMFYDILAAPTPEYIDGLIACACRKLNEAGITAVQSDDFQALPGGDWRKNLAAFERMAQAEKLTVRVYEQCLFTRKEPYEAFLAMGRKTGCKTGLFQIGPLKMLQDGSLGARTAALNAPYEDAPEEKGMVLFTQEQLDEMVSLAHNNGMQVAIHGIGDRAMDMILGAVRKAQTEHPRTDARHGIVHAQITNPRILKEMQELSVMAYIQPVFTASDMDVAVDRVGAGRMDKIYAWKTMMDMGILAAGGSDAPVESFDVLENIYYAVTRQKTNGTPEGGWLAEEALPVFEAVKLFTVNGARAAFEESERGTISEGKAADLVVLDEDIFSISPQNIKNTAVRYTIVNGKIVYENKNQKVAKKWD